MGMLGLGAPSGTRPGLVAMLVALVFAVAAFVALLFVRVPVDDRGEDLPLQYRGLYIEVRSMLTGQEVETTSESIISVNGPTILLLMAVPLAVAVVAFVFFRRSSTSRPVTISMLAMAAAVILTGQLGIWYMPSLIALAVGGFQVRKAELPARMADRASQSDQSGPVDE
jgi:cytochrome bd-type quinol oxidase subunit 2